MDLAKVRDVSWLGIQQVRQSTLPFDDSEYLRSLVEDRLATRFPEQRNQLTGAAVVCGDMAGEQHKFQNYRAIRFSSVDGFDLSPKSLERFHTTSFAFHPTVTDCNHFELEAGKYHLIVGLHGIHHLENVRGLFDQCHRGLADGGLLLIEEYVGPPRLQIPAANARIARWLLSLFFRKSERVNHEGRLKGPWLQYPPEAFDPSEAVNAAAIPGEFECFFEPVYRLEYGGLCYPMFEGLAGHFRKASRRIQFIIWLERFLQRLGVVRPLFLFAIAEKRRDPAAPRTVSNPTTT